MTIENWQYELDPVSGCHLWTRRIDGNGYPIIWRGQFPYKAYLAVWEAEFGPVADGLVLAHMCQVRRCINVRDHLEAVTKSVNEMQKQWRYRAKRKHCKHGHPFPLNAIMLSTGGRSCRTCRDLAAAGARGRADTQIRKPPGIPLDAPGPLPTQVGARTNLPEKTFATPGSPTNPGAEADPDESEGHRSVGSSPRPTR